MNKNITFAAPMLCILLLAGCGSGSPDPTLTDPPVSTQGDTRTAPAGLVDVSMLSVSTDNTLKPHNGIVVFPTGLLDVTEVGIAEQFTSDPSTGTSVTQVPAEGEQFYAAAMDLNWEEGDAAATFSVNVDGQQTTVEEVKPGAQTLIVSAPKDADVELQVEFYGLEQTVDLTTGERTSADIPALYTGQTQGTIVGDALLRGTAQADSGEVSLTAQTTTLERRAWTNDLGWADEGQSAWILVEGRFVWDYTSPTASLTAQDEGTGWTLFSVDGTQHLTLAEHGDDAVFKVPAEEDQFSLQAQGTAKLLHGVMREGTQDVQTVPVDVRF